MLVLPGAALTQKGFETASGNPQLLVYHLDNELGGGLGRFDEHRLRIPVAEGLPIVAYFGVLFWRIHSSWFQHRL